MKRLLPAILLALVLAVPAFAAAQVLDPIIPDLKDDTGALRTCAAGWEAVIVVIVGLIDIAIALAVLIAVLAIVYAGFLFLLTPTNPENLSRGKSVLTNAVIGLLLVLGAWLIVNAILTGLGAGSVSERTSFLSGGTLCITPGNPFNPITGNGGGPYAGPVPSIPPSGPGSCDPATVKAAAIAGGYADVTDAEANTFACLARPESSCGANTTGARTPDGRRTSAAGAWQNLLGFSDRCHSLNIPACGNLQCSNAFSGGRVKPDPESQELAARCYAAISDLKCAAAAAICLNRQSGGRYSDWTADPRSRAQRQCIREHAGF